MRKVVLSEIIDVLSKGTDTSEALCSSFLKELFAVVAERLSEGESVEIDKVGTFSVGDGSVVYVPDEVIVKSLNSAFDCFEPVVLNDGVTDEMLSEEGVAVVLEDAGAVESESEEPRAESFDNTDDNVTTADEEPAAEDKEAAVLPPPIPEEDRVGHMENEEPAEADDVKQDVVSVVEPETNTVEAVDTGVQDEYDDETVDADRQDAYSVGDGEFAGRALYPLWKKLAIFLSGVACGAAVYFVVLNFFMADVKNAENVESDVPEVAVADSVSAAHAQVAVQDSVAETVSAGVAEEERVAEPVYYKVEKTSYLSNISRKYYGHYAFWIYIYIENKDKIRNPDNLPVGMTLVIPPAEKYGIDKNNPESIYEAEKKAVELFGE